MSTPANRMKTASIELLAARSTWDEA